MKVNLDDLSFLKKLDRSRMFQSIEFLYKQIEQVWKEKEKLQLPYSLKDFSSIVFSAMGGSALGAYVVKNLYFKELRFPFSVVNDYHLPGWTNEKTLVIIQSYSGTTEETISSLKEAIAKKTKIITIASGGEIEKISKEKNIPFFKIYPLFNPCNQPRMGIGYAIFILLAIFNKIKLISLKENEIKTVIQTVKENNLKYGIEINFQKNLAKKWAEKIFHKLPILVGGEFLIGALHTIRNQINENAKSLAVYFSFPELNHHLLEALSFPKNLQAIYLFFDSSFYSERIKKRIEITKQIIKSYNFPVLTFSPSASHKLAQLMETISFGAYLGYYLAILYQTDPSPIPNVTRFKQLLK